MFLPNNLNVLLEGSLTINTPSVWDDPVINPNFLSSDFDIGVLLEGVTELRSFLASQPFNGFLVGPYDAAGNTTDSDVLTQFIREQIISVNRPMGTAKISKSSDPNGVVDPKLLLKNAVGLRIVDASVMVSIISDGIDSN